MKAKRMSSSSSQKIPLEEHTAFLHSLLFDQSHVSNKGQSLLVLSISFPTYSPFDSLDPTFFLLTNLLLCSSPQPYQRKNICKFSYNLELGKDLLVTAYNLKVGKFDKFNYLEKNFRMTKSSSENLKGKL